MKNFAPAAERNKHIIGETFGSVLPARGLVLEVASGSGQHVAHLAGLLPELVFQPSDADPGELASIRAWVAEAHVTNVRDPIALDACADRWPIERADAIVCINMIHIAPWPACVGLVAGAGRLLPSGAPLVVYGPFARDGVLTPASNVQFDHSLRRMDPAWGIRDLRDIAAVAVEHGLILSDTLAMPANNLTAVFRKAQ